MREYKGLFIPVPPKKAWKWMLTDSSCGISTVPCRGIICKECIYSWENSRQRQQFYKETFNKEQKETKMKKETKKGTVMELPNKEKVKFKFKQGDIVTVVNPNGTVSTYEIDSPMYDMDKNTCSYILTDGNELKEEHISHKLNCEQFSKYVIRGNNTEELKKLILLCSEEV
jgi:hypothetical protein